jgi:peptide deformylase
MLKPIVNDLKILRHPCEEVIKNDDIREIIQDLKDTLVKHSSAFGLSANQIGYNKRICYIRVPGLTKDKKIEFGEYVLINPKIENKERKIMYKGEGCVSFPGIYVTTDRYIFISVYYLDENLKECTGLFQDLESFVVQHSIDHLNGLTIFDKKHKDINRRKK